MTLKEYILIDSNSVSVEIFITQDDNSWKLTEFKQLPDSFTITTINLTFNLKDIYNDAIFEE